MYKSSRLYKVRIPPAGRAFLSTGHRPRKLYGVRMVGKKDALGFEIPQNVALTLCDDRKQVRAENVPASRCDPGEMATVRAAAGVSAVPGPVVPFTVHPFMCDPGASWVTNLNVSKFIDVAVELFFLDNVEQ